MKTLLRLLLIFGLSWLAQLYLPWWSVAVVAFLICLVLSEGKKRQMFTTKKPAPVRAFLAGFLALTFLWGGMAWSLDSANESIMSSQIGAIILQGNEPALGYSLTLLLVTALIGGLIGGFSAMTGNLLGVALKSEKDS